MSTIISPFVEIKETDKNIITCIPKADRQKHFLINWRPLALLIIVYKLASDGIVNGLKLSF